MCKNLRWRTKQPKSLIYEMTAQVIQDPAAWIIIFFFPAVFYFRSETVKMRFEFNYLSQLFPLDDLPDGPDIAVPASVVVHAKDPVPLCCQCRQVFCFSVCWAEGFFHDYVFSCH